MRLFLFVLLFCGVFTVQSQDFYEDRWNEIEELELKNKIEDAQRIVRKIYRKARRKDNHPQIIKAFLYQSKFKLINEEDALVNIQADLEELIDNAAFPEKNLYHFIYAKMLWRYQTENYRRLQSINESMNEPKPDNFLTWPRDYLNEKIEFHFNQALINPDQLVLINIGEYQVNISELTDEDDLFPHKLLDLIAQEAIEFQKDFGIGDVEASKRDIAMQIGYMSTSEINNLTWKSDWDSNVFKVIQLYVMLENSHLKEPQNVPAYIKNINDRFLFIKSKYSGSKSAAKYRSSAQTLITRFKNIPDHTLISYHLAEHYLSLSPLKSNGKVHWLKRDSTGVDQQIAQNKHRARAIELAQEAIRLFPESYGGLKATFLLDRINQPYAKLNYISNIAPDEPQRTRLFYRNIDNVRIYFSKINFIDAINPKDSLKQALFDNSKALNDFVAVKDVELPDAGDTFKREREILLPSLPVGNYLITLEYDSASGKQREMDVLQITALGVFSGFLDNNFVYQVLDKKTGFPISEVGFSAMDSEYKVYDTLETDKDGRVKISKALRVQKSIGIVAFKGSDSVRVNNYDNTSYRHNSTREIKTKKTVKTFVYLDRGIYRPGQEVFFKVINVVLENGKKSILPNETFNFYVTAPNNKQIYEGDFTSNEYGSFHGSFTLPDEVLQGEFTIEVESDEKTAFWRDVKDFNDYDVLKTFNVEAYKRPRFEVVFDNADRDYLVQDTVRIKAIATAFLGAAITDAQVSYTVKRKVYVPWWERSYRYYMNEERLIKQVTFEKDSLTTNAQGEIILDFVTEVDPNVFERYPNASRSYKIEIKVTDSNGETVIETTSINAVKEPYRLVINNPDRMTLKNRSLQLYLENLERQKLPAQVELQVFKTDFNARPNTEEISTLVNSEITERQRDSIFSESMYYQIFIKNIPDSLVYSKIIDLKDVYELDLPLDKSWSNGYYKIKLTTIADPNHSNTDSELIGITAQKTLQIWIDPSLPLTTTVVSHTQEIINGKLHLNLYTSVDSVYVNLYASSNGALLYEKQLKVLEGRNTYVLDYNPIPGSKTNFYYSLMHENRGLYASLTVQRERIKESDYSIKTSAFRDKLRPGLEEKWSFQIKDNQGNPFAAEFLASMYDQSLDTFASNEWKPFDFENNANNDSSNYGYLSLENDVDFCSLFGVDAANRYVYYKPPNSQFNFYGFLDVMNSYKYRSYLSKLRLMKMKENDYDGIVAGVVTDPSGEAIFGVTVQIRGTRVFTTTNFDGVFFIDAKADDTIVVSYSGYDTFMFKVNNLSYIPITLGTSLNEVVVMAYRSSMGDVDDISVPNASPVQQLLGQIPGVQAGVAQQSINAPLLPDSYAISENSDDPLYFFEDQLISTSLFELLSSSEIKKITYLEASDAMVTYGNAGRNGVIFIQPVVGFTYQDLLSLNDLGQIQTRKNLNETAFFIPDLYTDDKGNLSFSFTSPEMLTRWKFQLLGHNKDAAVAYLDKEVVTQKDLSIVPNPPRFLRELDTLVFSSKLINLSKNDVQAIATIDFYDTLTNEKLSLIVNDKPSLKKVSIAKNKSVSVAWKIAIPENRTSITYKIKASAGNFTDGEENTLPVLSNKILITESTSMWVPAGEERSMKLEALNSVATSVSQPLLLTMDYTTNAGWSALESLPYLMDYQHECAEQTFSKYYANAVAAHTVTNNPELQEMFQTWSTLNTTEVAMNKSDDGLIRENMPWALQMDQKEQQLKRFAQHFDSVKTQQEQLKFINRLDYLQMDSGMFPWFQGGKANPYITTHIVTGLGALQHSGLLSEADFDNAMYKKALIALDNHWITQIKNHQKDNQSTEMDFDDSYWQYAYARSFKKTRISTDTVRLLGEFRDSAFAKAEKSYASQNNHTKLLIALTAHRNGKKQLAKHILEGLQQTAVKSELYGMYWKSQNQPYRSHNDIETQALVIQAFIEINEDYETARRLQMWLLYKKSKSYWTSTKTTTQAIQAILAVNSSFKSQMQDHRMQWGGKNLDQIMGVEVAKEPSIGLVTAAVKNENITPDLDEVTIKNRGEDSGFASMQYQYLQPVDQIKTAANKDLSIKKILFRKTIVDNQAQWTPILSDEVLKLGDVIKVKLQITARNDQSYIHVKDLRASGLEPLKTDSGHHYSSGGLYYETTKDASQHYYFERLNEGIHLLEYDLVVNNLGSYSTGVATIESMYAPELNAHSSSERIVITQ